MIRLCILILLVNATFAVDEIPPEVLDENVFISDVIHRRHMISTVNIKKKILEEGSAITGVSLLLVDSEKENIAVSVPVKTIDHEDSLEFSFQYLRHSPYAIVVQIEVGKLAADQRVSPYRVGVVAVKEASKQD